MKPTLLVVLSGLSIIAAAMVLDALPGDDEVPKPSPTPAETPGEPVSEAATIYPTFDVVRINGRGGAVMAGRAAPRATVIVLEDGREIGRVAADRRGEWVFVPDEPLGEGRRELALQALNAAGTAVDGREPVLLTIPGGGDSGVVEGPPATQDAPPGRLAVTAVTKLGHDALYVTGRARAGASVHVYLDGIHLGTVKADGEGRWRLASRLPNVAGKHTVRADEIDAGGQVVDRLEVAVDAATGPAATEGDDDPR